MLKRSKNWFLGACGLTGRRGGRFLYGTPGAARPRTPRSLFVRTKSDQKAARTYGSGLPLFYGGSTETQSNEELRCHVNKQVLRGSDLVVWYLKDSGCRPVNGMVPARGTIGGRALGRWKCRRDTWLQAPHRVRWTFLKARFQSAASLIPATVA